MSAKSVSTKAISVIVAIVAALVASSLWVAPQAHATTEAYTNLIPTGSEDGDALTGKQVTFNGHRWYIIQDNSSSATEGSVTLLAADSSFGRRQWGERGATDYNTSWAKSYLDDLVNSGSFKYVADTMKDTENGKLYLLSIDEANAVPQNVRALKFEAGLWPHPFEAEGLWWLREKGSDNETVSFVSGTTGEINTISYAQKTVDGLMAYWNLGIRPAMQLNLRYVLFDTSTKSFSLKPYYDHMLRPNESEEALPGRQVNFNGCKWYLIDENITDPRNGTVTLLAADDSFGTSAFGESDNYANSTVKSKLDALTATDGAFEKVAEAMVNTENGKMYLLSKEEAEGLEHSAAKSGGHNQWWLRSGGTGGNAAYVDTSSGSVNDNGAVSSLYGVRPAVQLDLSKAMYVSSAKTFALTTYTDLIPKDGDDLAAKKVYFHKRPWYIIEDKSADPNQPYVKLLAADTSFGYSSIGHEIYTLYPESEVKVYLDAFAAPGGAFGDVANVLIGGFNLLTEDEANALPSNVRSMNFPQADWLGAWWTCTTPIEDYAKKYVCVRRDGVVVETGVDPKAYLGVRPYIKLDLTGVSFDPNTQMFTEHKHDFVYSTSGDTVTAVCRNLDGICKLPNCTATLQIVKPTLTTYGQTGEGISAETTIVDEVGIRGNASVEYYKVLNPDEGQISDKLPKAPTDAGTYLATIRIDPDNEASEAYVVYTIEKADNPATVQNTADAVAGGKTVDLAGNVSLNGATGTVSYAIDGEALGCTISDEGVLTTGDSAGTVKVTVTVAEDDNHKALEPITITVTITEKHKQIIEAADVAATYGDTDKAVSAKVTSPAEGAGEISYAVKDGSEDYIAVDAATGALTIKKVPADGKAYVVVTAAETETSSQATKDVTVTIDKADVVPPLVRANGWTADGTVRPLVTADGTEGAGGMTRFALGGNASNAPADSAYGESIPTTADFGTYYVWYKVFGDENHNDSASACVRVNVAAPANAGVDGPTYTISTTDEWNEFAWKVNNGTTFSGVVVQLADDISVSTMAGRSDCRFKGTFDGAGHTLTFNCSTSDEHAAPFRYVDGARFVNLKVTGTIETSKKFAGGFVGDAKGSTTFTSCHSNVTINTSVNGDGTHGGFVARTDAAGARATFTDCLFDGAISGAATNACGGFVGWSNNNSVTFTNCLNAGTFTISADDSATFSRSRGTGNVVTNNSYYHTAYGTAQGTQTDETGEALRAKLGDGWMVSTVEGEDVIPRREALAKLDGEGTVDAPYVIASVEEWDLFAQLVDDGSSFDGKIIRLDADITVSKIVGSNGNRFKGTFDGGGHTLTFNCTATQDYAAPFRYVEGAKFANLTVAGTIQTSARFAGGFVADAKGNTTFASCHSNVTIDSSAVGDGTHGGFVARTDADGAQTAFTDCLFDGAISGAATNDCGGFVGWPDFNNVTFTNCMNAGEFSTSTDGCATFSRSKGDSNVVTNNCYYKTAYGAVQGTQTDETGEALQAMLGDGWTVNAKGKAGVVPGASDAVELGIKDYDTVKFAGMEWIVLDAARTNGYLSKEALEAGGRTASGMLLLAKGGQGTTSYNDSKSWCAGFYTNKINDNAKTAVLGVAASDGIDGTGSGATDKAFLLSPSEYDKYNGSSTASRMIPTISNPGQWWLRTGEEYVGNNGNILADSVATTSYAARPAVNLKLDHIIVFDNTSPKTIKSFEEAVADDKVGLQRTIDHAEATRDYVAKGYTNESKQAVTDAVAAGNECIATDHRPQTAAETRAVLAEIAAKKAAVQKAESGLTVAAYDVPGTSYTVRVGDEIHATGVDLSASAAAGKAYGGNPMFRVLKVEDGRMLLMSEYLWAGGKGSNSFGRMNFGSAGNAWQGSAAQGWAAAFGEDVLGQIKGLAVDNVPGNVTDKAYSVPDGQASGGAFTTAESRNILTEQDKVFFLSGEEALEFMKQKGDRVAKLYGEGGADDASYWWLRSAVQDGAEVGYMVVDGSAAKRSPALGGYARPAFWADMQDIDPLTLSRSVESVEGTSRVVYTIFLHKHEWGEPTYTWADDNGSVTAKRVCVTDATHVQEETVDATAKVTKQPTCEAKGETTYTSDAFGNDAFKVQAKTVEDVDIVDHSWSVFEAQGATITAKCSMCGTAGPTLTITAPTLTTYGQEGEGISAEATVEVSGEPDIRGDAHVVYYKTGASGEKDGEALAGAPTDAGTYQAEITLGKGEGAATAHVAYAIAKADPVAVVPEGLKATYGQTLADVALANPDGNTAGTWTWDDPATTPVGNAGENAFKASFAPEDAANYNAAAGVDVAIAVAKAGVDAPEIAPKPYTGQPQAADVPESDLYKVARNEGGTAAGSYDVVLTLKDTDNYKWADSDEADKTLEFRIVADGKNYVTVALEGWTYGEQPNAPESTATYGADTVEYSYAASEDGPFSAEVPTQAGAWHVRASVAATDNYAAGEATAAFEIAKAAPAFEAPRALSPAYGGGPQALVEPGATEDGTMLYSLDGEAWSEEVPAAARPGAYVVLYRVAGDANHGDSATGFVPVVVAKGDPAVEPPVAANPAYTGQPQALVEPGSFEGGKVLYALGPDATSAPADGAFGKEVPAATDAGTYHVWYRGAGDENHSDAAPACVVARIAPADVSKAEVSGVSDRAYTGKAIEQSPTVRLALGGKTVTLKAGTDYAVSHANNVDVGAATVTVTGKGNYAGNVKRTFKITATSGWERLYGSVAMDTMAAITQEYGKAKAAVVATNAGFKDSLSGAALAGGLGAPMLTTAKGSLSAQTKSELKRMGVKTVYLVGSTAEVSANAEKQIKALGIAVKRIGGKTASERAVAAARQVKGRSDTVIVSTQNNFKDALAVSPYAYASKSPILYAEADKRLSAATVAYIKSAGFKKAIIVGGPIALPEAVEAQLRSAGIAAKSITRLAGSNQYKTARVVAEWATGQLKNGTGGKGLYQYASVKFQPSVKLSANRLGVARADNDEIGWKDALAGAALCGKNRSVLLLADEVNDAHAVAFVKANRAQVKTGYVFGGPKAVPQAVMDRLVKASGGAEVKPSAKAAASTSPTYRI